MPVTRSISHVCVLGAGTMGSGIAAVLAAHGYTVSIYDPQPAALLRARERVGKRAPGAKLNTAPTVAEAVAGAQLIIEAVPEVMSLKRQLLAQVDAAAVADAVVVSNTSQFSVTLLAGALSNPERFCGMHWFNPPERMQLIEGVRAEQTSDATLALVAEVAEACGKRFVAVRDAPGFVVNRVMAAALVEAMRMVDQGVANPDEIDTLITLGLNHPMGPLALADYVGLDVMLAILESLEADLGGHFSPPEGLRQLVKAGRLGRKSGGGYHPSPSR